MTGFWGEMEKADRCVELVEQLLKEEENILKHFKEKGIQTCAVDYRIARMKYALGETDIKPVFKRPEDRLEDFFKSLNRRKADE